MNIITFSTRKTNVLIQKSNFENLHYSLSTPSGDAMKKCLIKVMHSVNWYVKVTKKNYWHVAFIYQISLSFQQYNSKSFHFCFQCFHNIFCSSSLFYLIFDLVQTQPPQHRTKYGFPYFPYFSSLQRKYGQLYFLLQTEDKDGHTLAWAITQKLCT